MVAGKRVKAHGKGRNWERVEEINVQEGLKALGSWTLVSMHFL